MSEPYRIGASEWAGILGISPFKEDTPFAIYNRKLGLIPPKKASARMKMGLLMEPVIQALYEERTGHKVVDVQVKVTSEEYPFLGATLDAGRDDGRPAEFKLVGWQYAQTWGEAGDDEATDQIPDHYLIQAHAQAFCSGAEKVDVAPLIGMDDFRVYTVPRDDELLELTLPKILAFHDRLIRRNPPEITEPADIAVIHKLWPSREEPVALGPEDMVMVERMDELKASIKEMEEEKKSLKAKIILAMDGHVYASLSDGRSISRKVIHRSGYTVEPNSYPDFRFLGKKR